MNQEERELKVNNAIQKAFQIVKKNNGWITKEDERVNLEAGYDHADYENESVMEEKELLQMYVAWYTDWANEYRPYEK